MSRKFEMPVRPANGEDFEHHPRAKTEESASKGWVKTFVRVSILVAAGGTIFAAVGAAWILIWAVKGEQAVAAEAKLAKVEEAQKNFEAEHEKVHAVEQTERDFFKATLVEMNARQQHMSEHQEKFEESWASHLNHVGDPKSAAKLKRDPPAPEPP